MQPILNRGCLRHHNVKLRRSLARGSALLLAWPQRAQRAAPLTAKACGTTLAVEQFPLNFILASARLSRSRADASCGVQGPIRAPWEKDFVMSRVRRGCVTGLLAVCAPLASAFAADFKATVNLRTPGKLESFPISVKGSKYRLERTIDGDAVVIIVDPQQRAIQSLVPRQRILIPVRLGSSSRRTPPSRRLRRRRF